MSLTWGPPIAEAAPLAPPVLDRKQLVHRKLEGWANQLIDQSGKNRLLHYKSSPKATLEFGPGSDAAADLLAGKKVKLSKLWEGSEEKLKPALRQAEHILKTTNGAYEELGFSTLFLGLHMVSWPAAADRAKPCAPLLLCPIDVQKRSGGTDFDLRISSEWEVNEALQLVLATRFQTKFDGPRLLDGLATGTGRLRTLEIARSLATTLPKLVVDDRIVVSNFSYQDIAVVEDLRSGAEAFAQNDLVAALAGFQAAKESVRSRNAVGGNGQRVHGTFVAPFLVQDADSSQEAAIRTALDGHDLVIEGPPGTGKSQTIANLIASLIANQRSVLFVAEKRAAIDAVGRYLGAADLDDLMFDLHSGVESPRRVATAVSDALNMIDQISASNYVQLDVGLEERRVQVDRRCGALHEVKEPWKISLWTAMTGLYGIPPAARIEAAPIAPGFEHALTVNDLDAAAESMQRFVELDGLNLVAGRSAWSFAHQRRSIGSSNAAADVRTLVDRLTKVSIPGFRQAVAYLVAQSGIVAPAQLDGWKPVFDLFGGVHEDLSTFDAKVFDSNLDQLVTAYAPVTRGILLRAASTLTSADYRAARREIAALVRAAQVQHSPELHQKLAHASATRLEWSKRSNIATPTTPDEAITILRSWHQQFLGELKALEPLLGGRPLDGLSVDAVEAHLTGLLGEPLVLDRLPTLGMIEDKLSSCGLAPLLAALAKCQPSGTAAAGAVRWVWHRMVVGRLMTQDEIAGATRETLERNVAEFSRFDTSLLESTPARVRRRWAEHVHETRERLPDQYESLKQLAKARSGIKPSSIRRLLSDTPELLLALRPCWTMSPLIVSKLLPQVNGLFDVVIFDEASQVKPVHGLPALFRAKRVVVCGDDKQLPPTQFFDLAAEDDTADDNDEPLSAVDEMESILDVLASTVTRKATLRWHYRSRDERLIAFCNARMDLYANRLLTFPGAKVEAPLRHVEVTAPTNDRATSPQAEVARVVDLVREHARQSPTRTLGVITFGIQHALRIDAAIQSVRMDDPYLSAFLEMDTKEPFFAKSIERVQGDERDSIIVSVGLGHNSDGRLLNRLSVINQDSGIRRLNVAFTRAKSDLTIVTSFGPTEMSGPSFSSTGAQMLSEFVRYAASGGTTLSRSAAANLNGFESDIAAVLTAKGIPHRAQWGASGFFIDFALEHRHEPGRFVLAVECDGRTYHSSPTARDRDRLRQQHLERLGWSFHRIWSTEWYKKRDSEIESLVDAYEEAMRRAASAVQTATPSILAGSPSAESRVHPVSPPTRGPRPDVPTRSSIDQYSKQEIVTIVRWVQSDTLLRERDQLVRSVATELGFPILGSRIRRLVEEAVDSIG